MDGEGRQQCNRRRKFWRKCVVILSWFWLVIMSKIEAQKSLLMVMFVVDIELCRRQTQQTATATQLLMQFLLENFSRRNFKAALDVGPKSESRTRQVKPQPASPSARPPASELARPSAPLEQLATDDKRHCLVRAPLAGCQTGARLSAFGRVCFVPAEERIV